MAPKTCKVCEEAESKYKCPACLVPYCSLGCYKKHKENPCVNPKSSSVEITAAISHAEKPYYVEEPNEKLNQTQLESLVASGEIREALRNEELHNLIYQIDSSADAESELEKAMEGEVFRIFSEKILATISP